MRWGEVFIINRSERKVNTSGLDTDEDKKVGKHNLEESHNDYRNINEMPSGKGIDEERKCCTNNLESDAVEILKS